MIDIITASSPKAFKERVNEFLAKNPNAKAVIYTARGIESEKGFHGIFDVGNNTSPEKVKLDKNLMKQNNDLTKEIESLTKENEKLQGLVDLKIAEIDGLKEDFNDKIALTQSKANEDGEKLQEQVDQLEEVNDKARKESQEFQKALESCKKESTALKASNTKLKNKIDALVNAE